jgi:hypothetical protein
MAGNGSGKTAIMAVLSLYFIGNFPKVRGFIGANTHDQLNRATLFRIKEIWKNNFGVVEYSDKTPHGQYVSGKTPPSAFDTSTHNFETYNNIMSFKNGAVVYIGSLENYKALDGIEVGWGMLDETKDTREDALKEVILGRLRQTGIYVKNDTFTFSPVNSKAVCPLYIFTAPAKLTWLNEMFNLDDYESEITKTIFNKKDYFHKTFNVGETKKTVIIASTYSNKKNLPSSYIPNLLSMLPSHLVDSKIFGSPFTRSGGEFYIQFDRQKTVQDFDYDPDLPLHVSFDENYVPYMPCGIFQAEGKDIAMIKEICLKEPRNNIFDVCREIKRIYATHKAGMFIYGDATSKKGDAKLKGGIDGKNNLYKIIRKELSEFRPVFKVPDSNPSVVTRGAFINSILEKNIFDINFYIHSECKITIADFSFLKQDANGKKLKETEVDKNTKQRYQKYGHTSDLCDYFLTAYLATDYRNFQRPEYDGTKVEIGAGATYKKF